jgi:hypothetical protein
MLPGVKAGIRESGFKITPPVQNAQDSNRVVGHSQRDYGTAFKPHNPQSGTQVIAADSSVGKYRKGSAGILDTFDVTHRSFGTIAERDEVVEVDQIAERFRAEFNSSVHAVSSADRHASRE